MLESVARVLLIGDSVPARERARTMLADDAAIEVVGEHTLADARVTVEREQPDVAVLAVQRPTVEDLGACREISGLGGATRVLVVAEKDSAQTSQLLFRFGAHGVLTRTDAPSQLRGALHEVRRGSLIVPASIAKQAHEAIATEGAPATVETPRMTHREVEILREMAEGRRNQEIAESLGIGLRTVETHIRHVMLKLGVNSRTQAVVRAMKHGLLEPGQK